MKRGRPDDTPSPENGAYYSSDEGGDDLAKREKMLKKSVTILQKQSTLFREKPVTAKQVNSSESKSKSSHPPKKKNKDRWASSESEDDEEEKDSRKTNETEADAADVSIVDAGKKTITSGEVGNKNDTSGTAQPAATTSSLSELREIFRAQGADAATGAGASSSGLSLPADSTSSTAAAAAVPAKAGEESAGAAATVEEEEEAYDALLSGCRSVNNYEQLNKIDEGTYGVVFRAKNKKTGEIVALKQVKMDRNAQRDGFPITALRETNILLALQHENIIRTHEMVVGSSGGGTELNRKVFMVMEYMEHDIKRVMSNMKQPFTQSEVKCLMLQLLRAIDYMHHRWYLHRDLKTSNILYDNRGRLAVCDFGLARKYGDPVRNYTSLVVTLWYRSPELLLGCKTYSTAVDMWSVGCIFAEFVLRKPLFNGKSELEQLQKIFKHLGTPTEERWPGYSKLPNASAIKWKHSPKNCLRELFPSNSSFTGASTLSNHGFGLLNAMLSLDPEQRISAKAALEHPYFTEQPPPKDFDMMPTYADTHNQR